MSDRPWYHVASKIHQRGQWIVIACQSFVWRLVVIQHVNRTEVQKLALNVSNICYYLPIIRCSCLSLEYYSEYHSPRCCHGNAKSTEL